jgi:DNA-binding MarR family transcriptional regulator
MSISPEEDLALLFAALNAAVTAEVVRRLATAGFGDLRPTHGYVFQHLIPGPARIGDLAIKLGMTQQGASKLVVELEDLGYVLRRVDPEDHRNRFVELTARGWAGIEAGREARAAVTTELRAVLGDQAAADLIASLQKLAEYTGGLQTLLARRLRPER